MRELRGYGPPVLQAGLPPRSSAPGTRGAGSNVVCSRTAVPRLRGGARGRPVRRGPVAGRCPSAARRRPDPAFLEAGGPHPGRERLGRHHAGRARPRGQRVGGRRRLLHGRPRRRPGRRRRHRRATAGAHRRVHGRPHVTGGGGRGPGLRPRPRPGRHRAPDRAGGSRPDRRLHARPSPGLRRPRGGGRRGGGLQPAPGATGRPRGTQAQRPAGGRRPVALALGPRLPRAGREAYERAAGPPAVRGRPGRSPSPRCSCAACSPTS
jgi:hypothetical protein